MMQLIDKKVTVRNQTVSGKEFVEGIATIRGYALEGNTEHEIYASVQFPGEEPVDRWIRFDDVITA